MEIEVRRNDDGTIDEIVGQAVYVHLEQMRKDGWFLQIGEHRFSLYRKGKKVNLYVYDSPDEASE